MVTMGGFGLTVGGAGTPIEAREGLDASFPCSFFVRL